MMKINEMQKVYKKVMKAQNTFIDARAEVSTSTLYGDFDKVMESAKSYYKSLRTINKICLDLGVTDDEGKADVITLVANTDSVEDFVYFCMSNKLDYKCNDEEEEG